MPLWARLIFAGFGAVLTTGSIAWFVWASDRVAEARDWPRAQGTVVATRIDEERSETRDNGSDGRTRISYSYHPVIAYTYQVGGRLYGSDTIWLAGGRSWDNPAEAQAFLFDYREGGPVFLVYNPADPSDAALIVEPPTPFIFIVTAMGLAFLAVAWFVPRERPGNIVGEWRRG